MKNGMTSTTGKSSRNSKVYDDDRFEPVCSGAGPYAGLCGSVTGLDPTSSHPRRYLWTDAFAVCNYLGFFEATGNAAFRDLALHLVRQVHGTLRRHRDDDTRGGWISGLLSKEGEMHPTAGGLRIGKMLPDAAWPKKTTIGNGTGTGNTTTT